MKKMNLGKTLEAAKAHSQQQFAATPPARQSKSELAALTESAVNKPARSPRPPAEKPKAKPIKRVRSIREIFSYSSDDAARLVRLMQRAAKTGSLSNKSEVVRAGLIALERMSEEQFIKMLQAVPRLKPGRPKVEPQVE